MSERESRQAEIVHECDFDHPLEQVWKAVTTPALLARWIGLAPGGGDTARSEIDYRIVETQAHERVWFAWHDPATDQPQSTVLIELEPLAPDRTRLRLTHRPGVMHQRAANDSYHSTRALAA
ncbi:SRPBCC domain-containing protein [Salinicola sp. RZ23]|uniref:SRPBCC family protein n=1 Tax=Salinicola sp. RZ23 TaxID=1949087 RepID=UPI000DA1A48C|nr:SRPBCC domain-containing protein [Salinicola sp. RZ23]